MLALMGVMSTIRYTRTWPSGKRATASGGNDDCDVIERDTEAAGEGVMMMNVMSTVVVTWSCSPRATNLRPHAEVFGQFLLDLHRLADHGRALDAEEVSDLLLHADLGDAAVGQRDGHVAQ